MKKLSIQFNSLFIYKVLSVFFLASIMPIFMLAQCPTGDLKFGTQSDLNRFLQDFPDCVHFEGSLEISQAFIDDVLDLSPLSNLKSIGGTLRISNHSQSSDVNWNGLLDLKNLETVGSWNQAETNLQTISQDVKFEVQDKFIFRSNRNLTSLGGVTLSDSLETFDLSYNWKLTKDEFDKLTNVKYVDNFILASWAISEVPSFLDIEVGKQFTLSFMGEIVNIDGLRFSDTLQTLSINKCASLNDPFDEFNTLKHIELLRIEGNEFQKTIPEFASLNSIGSVSLANYSELNDLSFFSTIEITGTIITINNTNIQSLDGLQLDKEKEYFLSFGSNQELIDISVLEDIVQFNRLAIGTSPKLSSLAPLRFLEKVNCEFSLNQLGINSLNAFSNLSSVGKLTISNLGIENMIGLESLEEIGQTLSINNNENLKNLNGLGNLRSIGFDRCTSQSAQIQISGNPILESIYDLSNVNSKANTLTIQNNPNLSACSVTPICQRLSSNNGTAFVRDNNQGCNSTDEVIENCNFNKVNIYFDNDEDQVQDADEQNIPIGKLNINDDYILIPNNFGNFGYFDDGIISFIEYVEDDNWNTTTGQTFFDMTDPLSINENLELGLYPKVVFNQAEAYLAFDRILCATKYSIVAVVKNTGTSFLDLSVFIDSHGKFIRANPSPIDSVGDEYVYEIKDLAPGAVSKITVIYEADGIENLELGALLNLKIRLEYLDESGDIVEKDNEYELPFLCAVDPNDKQVFPSGLYDDNYTLFEEDELQYLIRFQNTGNYPAEDIIIRDTLDENLDLRTFQFVHSSHPISQIKLDKNNVEFIFENIFLPDSIANEPESHGYVSYSIKTNDGLDENTRVENTAHIYFDNNPAIVTNTTFNTYVSEYPIINSIDESDDLLVTAYPNPTSDVLQINKSQRYEKMEWSIHDIQGKLINQGVLGINESKINVSALRPGLYLAKIDWQVVKFVKI